MGDLTGGMLEQLITEVPTLALTCGAIIYIIRSFLIHIKDLARDAREYNIAESTALRLTLENLTRKLEANTAAVVRTCRLSVDDRRRLGILRGDQGGEHNPHNPQIQIDR